MSGDFDDVRQFADAEQLPEFGAAAKPAQRAVDQLTRGPQHAHDKVIEFIERASMVKGKPFAKWPAWSTGELLACALILNRADVLKAMSYTMLEAVDRVDVLTPADMLYCSRNLLR